MLVVRIDKHLQQLHQLDKQSLVYKQALRKCRITTHNRKVLASQLKQSGYHPATQSPTPNNRLTSMSPHAPCPVIVSNTIGSNVLPDKHVQQMAALCILNVESQLENFATWLQSVDAGQLGLTVALQHKKQLQKIAQSVEGGCNKSSGCCEHTLFGDKLCQWFKGMAQRKVGTTRSYLASMVKFVQYLSMEFVGINKEQLAICKQRLKAWSSSLKKKDLLQRYRRQVDARREIITPKHVMVFRCSLYRKRLLNLLNDQKSVVKRKQKIAIRNLLITETIIANATRPSAVVGMTMTDWHNRVQQAQGFCSVSVAQHKTFMPHGPAVLTFGPELTQNLILYLSRVRKMFTNDSSDAAPLFVSANGERINSTCVWNAVKRTWKYCGLSQHLTASLYRKSCVTRVHELHPNLINNLASHMKHRVSTASSHYRLAATIKQNADTAIQLQSLMGVMQETSAQTSASHQICITKSPVQQPAHGRRSFTSCDIRLLEQTFSNEIKAKKITSDDVRRLLPEIKGQLSQQFKIQQVRDRIRFCIKCSKHANSVL